MSMSCAHEDTEDRKADFMRVSSTHSHLDLSWNLARGTCGIKCARGAHSQYSVHQHHRGKLALTSSCTLPYSWQHIARYQVLHRRLLVGVDRRRCNWIRCRRRSCVRSLMYLISRIRLLLSILWARRTSCPGWIHRGRRPCCMLWSLVDVVACMLRTTCTSSSARKNLSLMCFSRWMQKSCGLYIASGVGILDCLLEDNEDRM